MGLLDMFTGPKHPPLDEARSEAAVLRTHGTALADLVAQVGHGIEVVAAGDTAFAFIGTPPKAFGVAWLDGEGQHNLKKLAERKGLGFNTIADLTERLGAAYVEHKDAPRFAYPVGKKPITVIASPDLAGKLDAIITSV